MKEMCEDFKIQQHNSTPYRPKMNGAVEAANKNIKKIVQKMTMSYKDWHEMLLFAVNYEGPFVVKKALLRGALLLARMDDEELPSPVNSDIVKRYYA